MKFIVATSDNVYYRWQMLVQIHNFKKLGMLDDLIYVVSKTSERKSKYLGYIEKETGVKIYTYDDERKSKTYTSSIRPHIMKKFIVDHPEYEDIFFYLDPDVLYTEKPSYFGSIIKNDIWYLSDTRSYIDSQYIKRKSEKLFQEMCDIVGVDSKLIENSDRVAGGAQYIMKKTNYEYWDKVEKDCEELYKHMHATETKYSPKHPIQKWTADMWAVLWNGHYFGHRIKIWKELEFNWATTPMKDLMDKRIYHNAGAVTQSDLFLKTKYFNENPFNADFSHVSENNCSKFYVDHILEVKNEYPELVNKL